MPLSAWWQGAHAAPEALAELARLSLQEPVWAAAGIAEPERFFTMLEQQGLRLHRCPLPDHAELATPPWPDTAQHVVLTEKDAVKLPSPAPGGPSLWVVTLAFQLPDTLTDAMRRAWPGRERSCPP